jgi:hypothetical protein
MKVSHFQKKDLLPFLIYLYLFLPFVLFLIGWTKPIVSIPVLIVLAVCFFRMVRSFPELWFPNISRDDFFKIAFILFVIFVWVYFSGIGRLVFQNGDHLYRNALFQTLVEEKWPIINFSPPIENYKKPVALVYYFGFWLPPAIIGKLLGLTAGYITQIIWTSTGIFLFYYLIIAKYVQKIVFWPLLVFIFFSGLDILGMYLLGRKISDVSSTAHIEWWGSPFQFSSITTQLFWVFNQAVPVWLTTLVLLIQKNNRYIAVVIALTMITSTLPFVGLVMLAICIVTRNSILENNHKQVMVSLRDIFSFENIIGGGITGIISFLFLKTNISGNIIGFLNYQSIKGTVLLWFLFYIVEAGIYLVALWKYQKCNYLLYYCALWLAVCPWIIVGYGHDFCMRASIPALVIVMLLVIDTINKSRSVRDFKTLIAIVVILAIGSSTPIKENMRTTANTVSSMRNNQSIPLGSIDIWKDNFCGFIKNSFFFDYLARLPKKR